ncbi:3'-5' DNA helicase [Marasmius sp. AFHP31]|nr:3'-5' DNA helicase [Marasmius sp. AFHP31]
MKLKPDLLEAKHWVYPLNQPKRDYQFNIVRRALFDNTIVALPTGLGKTFVAGVVMLNFYRWFPEGKVVFVAPTKPLVAQQVEACHRTCGIPGSDAVELTGENPRAMRNRAWKSKRVFYMTPQTLINDLTTENCDARDIVLIVVDEAHRASGGDYAYNQVIRYMMAKNPYFRVLALTATPGSTPDAVQCIVDGLHISRIEIRDESSLDLRQYIHEKVETFLRPLLMLVSYARTQEVRQHIISMSGDVVVVRDLLAKLMEEFIKPLAGSGVIYNVQPTRVHPYFFQKKMQELHRNPNQKWAYTSLSRLGTLARCMGYLVEGTMGMCHHTMRGLVEEQSAENGDGKKGKTNQKLTQNPLFKRTLEELDHQERRGYSPHPKMEKMLELIIQHFGKKMGEPGEEVEETKAMVFVTHRQAVDEIVEVLESHKPLLRASRFIGQGTDVRGQKGQAQKEQLDVIRRFKANEFNVLVATSIGEEGLDIGEVDLILCYDAQKTPIRMLQRLGRTGRKRAGVVHVLLSEGREEQNLEKAKSTYKEVQKSIVQGHQLELFEDVERMLPDHIQPQCVEKQMEIQEYVRETGRSKSTGGEPKEKKGAKRKRNDDIGRNIPEGASKGFVSVRDLVAKQKPKKRKTDSDAAPKDFEEAGEDDDTDREIEAGVLSTAFLRKSTTTTAPSSKGKKDTKSKLRKSKTMPAGNKATNSKRGKATKKATPELTASQLEAKGEDDSDDMDIQRGMDVDLPASSPPSSSLRMDVERGDSEQAVVGDVIEVTETDSDDETGLAIEQPISTKFESPSPDLPAEGDKSIAWLVDDEDEDISFQIIDSSPVASRSKPTAKQALYASEDDSIEFVEGSSRDDFANDRAFLVDCVNDFPFPSPVKGKSQSRPTERSRSEVENESPVCGDMLPPPVPAKALAKTTSPPSSPYLPEMSFAIRPAGKRRAIVVDSSPMNPSDSPQPAGHRQRLLKRVSVDDDSPLIHRSYTKKQKRSESQERRRRMLSRDPRFYDVEAEHSGDEISAGSSGPEEDEENEDDRRFLEELPATQASPSYDQTQIYRESLMTQAPTRAPAFANKPVRRGRFGRPSTNMSNKRRPGVSSSPPPEGDESPDEYEFDSFIVDDDAEISYGT